MNFLKNYSQFLNENETSREITKKLKFLLYLITTDDKFISFGNEYEEPGTGFKSPEGSWKRSVPIVGDASEDEGSHQDEVGIIFGEEELFAYTVDWSYVNRKGSPGDYYTPPDPTETSITSAEISKMNYYSEGDQYPVNDKEVEILALDYILRYLPGEEEFMTKEELKNLRSVKERIKNDPALNLYREEFERTFSKRGEILAKKYRI
jgi:hypothetical protein